MSGHVDLRVVGAAVRLIEVMFEQILLLNQHFQDQSSTHQSTQELPVPAKSEGGGGDAIFARTDFENNAAVIRQTTTAIRSQYQSNVTTCGQAFTDKGGTTIQICPP